MRIRNKSRRVVDSTADSRIRWGWLVLMIVVASAVIWGANLILFTPVGR